MTFDDCQRAGNIALDPETSDRHKEAIARDGRLEATLRDIADLAGVDVLDVGTGTVFWLPRYARDTSSATGIDRQRSGRGWLAEHLLVANASLDVVHARFAYLLGRSADARLEEVGRVLRSGWTFIAVHNDGGGASSASCCRWRRRAPRSLIPMRRIPGGGSVVRRV